MPMNENLEEFVNIFYGNDTEKTAKLIEEYLEIYEIPKIVEEFQIDPHFFLHCKNTENCIVVVLYNQNREILLTLSQTMLNETETVGWRLLGGSVHCGKELIEESVLRVVKREFDVEISEIEPIAFIENHFCWDSNVAIHKGLAFMAQVIDSKDVILSTNLALEKHDIDEYLNRPTSVNRQRNFFDEARIPQKMAFSNKKIANVAFAKLKNKIFEASIGEVHASERPIWKKLIHKYLFKPVTNRASRRIKQKIMSYISSHKTIIDISAGNDYFILDIAKKFPHDQCIANDISFNQMLDLRRETLKRGLQIKFTNHNSVDLPFKMRFDLVLFKNTLHHIGSKEECLAIMKQLKDISKRIIIVDVDNPKKSRWNVRFANWYFEVFYGDGDDHIHKFHNMDSFQKLIRLAFTDDEADKVFDSVETIKGDYMIAVIDIKTD
jgi:ADP-ribose pyrophosphatase YjhB (NUDIX family)